MVSGTDSNSTRNSGRYDRSHVVDRDNTGPESQEATTRPEIPGMYWDEQRGRYFRILNTGQAPAASSGDNVVMQDYTISSLASRERAAERSINEKTHPLKDIAFAKYRHLQRIGWSDPAGFEKFEMNRLDSVVLQYEHTIPKDITTVHWFENADLLFFCDQKQTLYQKNLFDPLPAVMPLVDEGTGRSHKITSIGSNQRFAGLAGPRKFDGEPGFHVYVFDLLSSNGESIRFMAEDREGAECSTFTEKTIFNVGHTNGFTSLDITKPELSNKHLLQSEHVRSMDSRKDSLLLGCRNGKIYSYDRRSRRPQLCASHASGITNIGVADNSVVVSGLEDKMALFDLRSPATPIFEYGSYFNHSEPHQGLALSPSRGAVAVGLDDGSISVYHIATGKLLDSTLASTKDETSPNDSIVRSITWSEADGIHFCKGRNLYHAPDKMFAEPMAPIFMID